MIAGEKIGDLFVVHQHRRKQRSAWTVTHIQSGYAVVHFYDKDAAIAVATILVYLQCDWNWSDPASMPIETKEVCHEVFTALCKAIKSAPGNL